MGPFVVARIAQADPTRHSIVWMLGALASIVCLGVFGCMRDNPGQNHPCEACGIERLHVTTIFDSLYPGGALISAGVTHINTDGSFFVLSGIMPTELFMADSTGRIVGPVGRLGEGPGEYVMPLFTLETPSEYLVFDQDQLRVTRLAKETLELIRSEQFRALGGARPLATNPVAFSDGSFLIRGRIGGDPSGTLLHLVSKDGELIRSFGDSAAVGNVAPGFALSGDSAVWIAQRDRYRITKWSRTGKLLGQVDREVDWLPWPVPPPEPGQKVARLQGVFEDSVGRLWVYIGIRTRAEAEALMEQGGQVQQSTFLGLSADPAQTESVVELLDVQTGEVIASTRALGVRGYYVPAGFHEFVRAESASGQPLLEVWTYRLTNR